MNEQYKLDEAKFFLARMEESIRDREAFRYYMSAFLTAARSVTQYAWAESRSKGRQKWYNETIAEYEVLSFSSQTLIRHRFADWAEPEDRVDSAQRYSEHRIGSAQRYIEELGKFVQRGMEAGILSG